MVIRRITKTSFEFFLPSPAEANTEETEHKQECATNWCKNDCNNEPCVCKWQTTRKSVGHQKITELHYPGSQITKASFPRWPPTTGQRVVRFTTSENWLSEHCNSFYLNPPRAEHWWTQHPLHIGHHRNLLGIWIKLKAMLKRYDVTILIKATLGREVKSCCIWTQEHWNSFSCIILQVIDEVIAWRIHGVLSVNVFVTLGNDLIGQLSTKRNSTVTSFCSNVHHVFPDTPIKIFQQRYSLCVPPKQI